MRLWFGALLLFGSEILIWTDPFALTIVDWLGRGLVCTLIATLLLDLAARFRIRDTYDSMALLAIGALLIGLLIAPNFAHADFPRTLLTRVLGAYGLTNMEMFGLMLVLSSASDPRVRRLILPVAAWNGFYLGVWLRWMPVFNPQIAPFVPLDQALLLAGGVFAPCVALWWGLRQPLRQLHPLDLRLPVVPFLLLIAALIALSLPVLISGALTTGPLVASLLLIGLSYAVLYFRRSPRDPMLLDGFFPAVPVSGLWLVGVVVAFLAACLFAYHLPLAGNDQINQLWLMEVGFGAVGALWYPLVAAVLAFRAVDEQMRRSQL